MSDTTALDGSIDAVVASLIEGSAPETDDLPDDELVQSQEDDADDQNEGADEQQEDEADDGDQSDDADNSDEDEEEAETDAEDDDDNAEQLFTVNVDGRTQQVPLQELIRGYSGQAYIQKGMRDVAEARKETEAVYKTLQAERQQIVQFLNAAQTGDIPIKPPAPPPEDLLSSDPIGYLEQRLQYDKAMATYQQAQAVKQDMETKAAQAEERARQAYLAEQQQQLARVIPAFAKPETAAKVKQDLINAGTGIYGYTPEELQTVTDHRALLVLHDAAKYRQLMSGKAVATKQAATPRTPTIKAGVRPNQQAGKRAQSEKAKVQMRRSGSVDDVARFLLS